MKPMYLTLFLGLFFSMPCLANTDSGALFKAINAKDVQLVSNYLTAETVNKKNPQGDTPILASARLGDIKTMELLLSRGADINALDARFRDIANIAISNQNPQMVEWALKHGLDATMVTSVYQGSALIYACHQGAVEIVDMLVSAGAPLDRKNNIGWTALLEATILGDGSKPYQDIVQILVNAGADISIADRDGMTPLDHAKSRQHSEIVTILEKAK